MPIAATLALRFIQLLGAVAVLFGLQQIPPLIAAVNLSVQSGAWPAPALCGRLAAVTGPLLLGGFAIGGLQFILANLAQQRRAALAYPGEPWMVNPMWAAKHIRLSARPYVIGFLFGLALYILVALPLAIASEKRPFLIFAGVLGLCLVVFLRILWINRHWSRSELRLSTLPGVVGGPFAGVAILHQTFPTGQVIEASLKCQLTQTVRHHKSTTTKHVDMWSSTIHVSRPLSGSAPGTTAIPINFAIPYDCLSTNTDTGGSQGSNDSVRWLLSLTEKDKVGAGAAVFEVPVFRTSSSCKDYQLDAQLTEDYLEKIDPLTVLRRYNMKRSTPQPGEVRLEFHEYDGSIFYTLIVMSLMLIGAIAGIVYWVSTWEGIFFASLLPAAFLLMMLYGIVHMLFWKCIIETKHTGYVTPNPDALAELTHENPHPGTIHAQSGIFGLRKSISVPRTSDSSLQCKLDHRVNEKECWSICLSAPGTEPLKVLSTLNGSPEAQVVANWLAETLQLKAQRIRPEDGFLK